MAVLPWSRGMMSLSLGAAAVGGISGLAGFYVSYLYDLPLGPIIVCAAFAAFFVSQAARALYKLFT
jgi:zinc transport system permease protein